MARYSSLPSVGKVMALGCTVVSTVTCLRSLQPQRSALVRDTQALLRKPGKFLLAHTPAPARHRGAVVGKLVPEILLTGEVLEIGVLHSAVAPVVYHYRGSPKSSTMTPGQRTTGLPSLSNTLPSG